MRALRRLRPSSYVAVALLAWLPAAAAADPLDLRAVSFGQRDTQLWLRVQTSGEWSAGALAPDDLCLTLMRSRAVGRLCVGGDGRGHAVVRFRRAGSRRSRKIPAAVVRRDGSSVLARVYPHDLGLRLGPVRWFAESRGGADRIPGHGTRTATVAVLARPRCFGAAARAGARPCDNPALRRSVTPTPDDALLLTNASCRPLPRARRRAVLHPCEFGDLYAKRAIRVALIGDSHAAHLRPAVEVAAQARGRRAVSLTHPGCAFSIDSSRLKSVCRDHNAAVLRWLRAHPGVRTIYTSNAAERGFSPAGFLALWSQVPPTVRRIYVIRDVPRSRLSTGDCVTSVLRRHLVSAGACAFPRAAALPRDPGALAAAPAPGRVRLIDLTRLFCDATRCFPVLGGAYVYRDVDHLNRVFAATLGPYLL